MASIALRKIGSNVAFGQRMSALALRSLSTATIPVTKIASVLKLNVGNEETAVKLDSKMKTMTNMMRNHAGFEYGTRYVCKNEWAYELSFVFGNAESFEAWKTSNTRDRVHAFYLDALETCGIDEASVEGGARIVDTW